MRFAAFFMLLGCLSLPSLAHADTKTEPSRIVALGDSLTAGYGLESGEDFATKLQEALIAKGYAVKIDNAGVTGDTTAGGLARLEWAVSGEPKPTLVIVSLGANDMLRGLDPAIPRQNLDAILTRLADKKIPVLLAGMQTPPNMGAAYAQKFNVIYPELAKAHNVTLYPFFLDGVATHNDLNLADGIHPNQKGIAVMVEKMTPVVAKFLPAPKK